MFITFLTPRSLASREQAMTQVCCGILERHHAHRPAAQVRMHLLLDRGEEAVKVEIEPFDFEGVPHDPLPRGSEKNITRT